MFQTRGSRPSLLVVVGVVAMVASFFVLSAPVGAHEALIGGTTELVCDEATVTLDWEAVSWAMDIPNGRHPSITIDIRTDVTDWAVVGHGAFTDENGRRLSGSTPVPAGANWVQIRVTPDAGFTWETVENVGGVNSQTLQMSSAPIGCSGVAPGTDEATATPTEEPTVAPTQEPTVAPTQEPTATPTQEPTATPTEAPTATPTAQPTPTATEEVVVLPPAPPPTPTATPTPTPEVGAEVVEREPLARTGGESGFVVLVGLTLLVGGALFIGTGVSAARRET